MKNKYKIKHKWYEKLFFKYRYKEYDKKTYIEVEEAYRIRYIWFIPINLIFLLIQLGIGIVKWAIELPTICYWSNRDEGHLEVSIYTFDKEINEDGK